MNRIEDQLGDLIPDILSKLPVKSLMRFKCVNKSWGHMITNPSFISKHLVSFKQFNTADDISLLVIYQIPSTYNEIYLLPLKIVFSKLSFNRATNSFSLSMLDEDETFPLLSEFIGPCNGLYLFNSSNLTLLVNPSMREYRVMPHKHFEGSHFSGLGFDSRTKDYKIIVIHCSSCKQSSYQASLYKLSSNCWREVDCTLPTSFQIYHTIGFQTFVHGAFHWLAVDDKRDYIIVAYDMADEIFRIIRFVRPQIEVEPRCYDGNVSKYRESLAMNFYTCSMDLLQLWVMEEYANERSWTKLLTVGFVPHLRVFCLFGFWKDDELIVYDRDEGIVLYDLQSKEIKPVAGMIGGCRYMQVDVYEESIVSLRRDEENNQGVHFLDITHDPLFD
ncbi:hypothetical protein L6164_023055 [Bauhinia variegata]|uniref:Uncharacterized protein n=1 Tax=Bauhinia variegata TaxID=167791 RepID=A0ACB9MHH7_BAUVA|nr:hypothetical protein L6164_023055 [Bauhinia variegata]